MRILHTSDWHLGQKFIYHDRRIEHELALKWLLQTIEEQQIEVLLLAGDVFDIGNPPSYARKLYYEFLRNVSTSCCRHIVITAGNHDSPAMLDAPSSLLELFKVRVVSRATIEDVSQELIELKNEAGELEAVIAAVPFLRDQDLRKSVSGESGLERKQIIRRAIRAHYEAVGTAIEEYADLDIPLLAMGHLFVKDATTSAKHDNIYIGDMENIEAEAFPKIFDYVALGHIHRPQAMDTAGRVRYSGSIIPLSFSETKDEKQVYILDCEGHKIEIKSLSIPTFRRVKTIQRNSVEAIKIRLKQLDQDYKDGLPAWVEVILETEKPILDLDLQLAEWTKDMQVEILKTSMKHPVQEQSLRVENLNLHDLQPIEVFEKKLDQTQISEAARLELVDTFKELQTWMQEEET